MKQAKHKELTLKGAKVQGDLYMLRCEKCKKVTGYGVSVLGWYGEYVKANGVGNNSRK